MDWHAVLAGLSTGLAGGVSSGLLGVSPGGGLVVFSVLLLGAEQHVAQGVSLVAQIPPTSGAGIRRYHQTGSRSPPGWLVLLAIGFVVGGIAGALAANLVSTSVLRWAYVGYLVILDAMLVVRGRAKEAADPAAAVPDPSWLALLIVGLFAGLSSGFLGIGGGLATVVGLSAVLGVPQHQAQMISLVLSLTPTTIPSAWVYWRSGALAPWPVLIAVIAGLVIGTDLGARIATRIAPPALQRLMIGFVSAMAAYMAFRALS